MSEDKKTQDPQQEPELKEEAGAEAKKAEDIALLEEIRDYLKELNNK